MRQISCADIAQTVSRLCIKANSELGPDVMSALEEALAKEESPVGKDILRQILENHRLAAKEGIPLCQDTGLAVVFLEVGQDVQIVGGVLTEAVNEGVRQGYIQGYLRKSVVADPLRRSNTNDNTPAIIHTQVVPGDRLTITVAPKGGGSENMSALAMLPPSAGEEGLRRFVLEQVKRAGPNPCPPVVVGVGLGGNFEKVAYLAKKALLRPLDEEHADPFYARLERELLTEINNLGIGPQGLGGRITALAVHIEAYPCHITGMPVAVNMNCHAARHQTAVL
ncbi:MAG: fumarate hydratase [Limnochordia bacterium]|jgi:fumarate hydratase subunit alpha